MPRLSEMGTGDVPDQGGKRVKRVRRRDTPPSAHHLALGSICRRVPCDPKTATNVWLREAVLRERIAKAVDREVADFLREHPQHMPPDNGGAPAQAPTPAPPAPVLAPPSPPPAPAEEDWIT